MVDLSEAGARLAAHQPADPATVADIYRRRDLRRRRRRVGIRVAGFAVAAATAVIIAYAGPSSHRRQNVTTNSVPGTVQATTAPPATAEQLAAGHWSVLPPAPIPARDNPVVVWTGREIIVWGGESGPQGTVLHADGAAYDPSTGRWQVLPAAPISGRMSAAAVWTGSEMVIWGGYDNAALPLHVSAAGAAYNPATNRWRLLPPSPLSPRHGAQAVWTGDSVFILGGAPAVINSQGDFDADGALYNPAANTWQAVRPPPAPAGHGLDWVLAAQARDRTLAWSTWSITTPAGPDSTSTTAGVDFYTYNEPSGRWAKLDQSSSPVVDPTQAIWTGQEALLRGAPGYCGGCAGGTTTEVSGFYDPATNSWAPIAPDPIAMDQPQSAWTGAAIISVDLTSESSSATGSITPGGATAYDPGRQQWYNLPASPAACPGYAPPIWTGQQVIAICASPGTGKATAAGGLALTPGP
jgi:hypothetical protein